MNVTEQVLLEAVVQELKGLRRDMRGHRSNLHVLSGKDKKAIQQLWNRSDELRYAEQQFITNIYGKHSITVKQYFWLVDICEDYEVTL